MIGMTRAVLIGSLSLVLCATLAKSQTPERVYRLGVLSPGLSSYDTLRGQLAKLGFIEGRNLVVDVRVGAPDQLPRMAHELVATKPDALETRPFWKTGGSGSAKEARIRPDESAIGRDRLSSPAGADV